MIFAVGTLIGVYALIATERMHRTTATMLGVSILLIGQFIIGQFYPAIKIWHTEAGHAAGASGNMTNATNATNATAAPEVAGHGIASPAVEIFHDIVAPVDLNVIFLLFGMMVMVAITARTGIFQWLAARIYKWAEGRPMLLMFSLLGFTAVSSAFIDNVTTMLLVTPVTIELAVVLGVNPLIFLFPMVFASNIGGALTLVGDPPNILVGSYAGLTFTEFIYNLTPAVGAAAVVFCIYVYFRYGNTLREAMEAGEAVDVDGLLEEHAVEDWNQVYLTTGVLGVTVLLFFLHGFLEMEVAIPALIGAGTLLFLSQVNAVPVLEEVEWPTLVFFIMLFIMVGAVESTGALELVATFIADTAGGNKVIVLILIIWVSAIASALVDNIPFTATMLPVVGALTAADGAFAGQTGLWWALVFGADLGGNATLVGASANIVTAGLSERAGHPIKFIEFMKHGIPVAILTCLVGTGILVWQFGGI